MSKARELADVIGTQGTTEQVLSGRRNLIINGGFDVWQRGTSFSNYNGYTADHVSGAFTGTMTRQNFPTGSAVNETGYPFKYYARFNGTGIYLNWPIEDASVLDNQQVTVSYWARTSGGSIQLNPHIGQLDIGGDVWTGLGGQVISNTGWQRFSHTFTVPSLAGKTLGANAHSRFHFSNVNTGGYDLDIVGVQLEYGSVATPFEHRSYGEELALCQRYYYQRDYTATYNAIKFPVFIGSVAGMTGEFVFPVAMRTSPSLGHNGVGNFRLNDSRGNDQTCIDIALTAVSSYEATVNFTGANSTFTVGYSGYINTQSTNDATIYFDAEL